MKPLEISLQDFVSWGILLIATLAVLRILLGLLFRNGSAHEQRATIRRCAQCGLREKVGAADSKYGECASCGGVTSKGRSRKLG